MKRPPGNSKLPHRPKSRAASRNKSHAKTFTNPHRARRPPFAHLFLIIILGLFIYANSLNGEFIRDDNTLVRDNVYIKSWSGIGRCFTKNIALGGRQEWNSYRPLQMLTYALDYSAWKSDVRGYHLTNTLLHILTALALYWFINVLYTDKTLSFFTAVLFVTHPIHTGAVSYISGRADSLAALFMLLCLIVYIKFINERKTPVYIFMILTYAAALLSRENSLTLPLLLLVYHYAFKKKIDRASLFSLSALAGAYILLRLTVLKAMLSNISYTTTLAQRIPGFFAALAGYIKLLLLPFNLHTAYGNKLFNLGDPAALAGMAIMAALLIAAFKSRKKGTGYFFENDKAGKSSLSPFFAKAGKSSLSPFFALMWFIITLLPQSNLYPVNAYMAEHWLYLPSMGFFLIAAKGLAHLYRDERSKVFGIAAVIALVSFYSYLTVKQNYYWKEPVSFYKRTLKYAPDDFKEYLHLGNAYRRMRMTRESIESYMKAVKINPECAEAYNNLGAANYDAGKKKEAAPFFKKALEINPDYAAAYNGLALVYYDTGRRKEAVELYQKAIAIDPEYPSPYYNLANAHRAAGEAERAIVLYKKAIKADSAYLKAYNNLGLSFYETGRKEEAARAYKSAIDINPGYGEAYNNLAVLYYYDGKYDLAIKYCDMAVEEGSGRTLNPRLLKMLEPYR